MSGIHLLLGGDVLPTESTFSAFQAGDAETLLTGGLLEAWLGADARFFNLECPLTNGETPIEKCGPALRAPVDCVRGVAALRPDGVSLCNNHILDYGPSGLADTRAALSRETVPFFGAGENRTEADVPLYYEKDGIKVGLYALCEHEFSAASESAPGANPLDPLELGDRIRKVKAGCDYLILLYHGGRECYPYPSPMLQKTCRKAVSAGANLVLCQHSHCIGSTETYQGATILYGQGNFLFDVRDGEPCFDSGLIVSVTLEDGKAAVDYLPVLRREGGARLAAGAEKDAVLSGFFARSAELEQPGFVEETYAAYAASQKEKMLKVFLSGNPLLKAVNLLYGRKPSRVYGRRTLLNIKNTLMCESLNELIRRGLE